MYRPLVRQQVRRVIESSEDSLEVHQHRPGVLHSGLDRPEIHLKLVLTYYPVSPGLQLEIYKLGVVILGL